MNHLARGEHEKALLVFYTNLVYSMSQDCYQTVERIKLDQPNFSPFQQNASGNGRIIEMCRRMVIDEQDADTLWLLRGCPRRWFAPGRRSRWKTRRHGSAKWPSTRSRTAARSASRSRLLRGSRRARCASPCAIRTAER